MDAILLWRGRGRGSYIQDSGGGGYCMRYKREGDTVSDTLRAWEYCMCLRGCIA